MSIPRDARVLREVPCVLCLFEPLDYHFGQHHIICCSHCRQQVAADTREHAIQLWTVQMISLTLEGRGFGLSAE